MADEEISREQWATFFNDLSRQRAQGLVTVEVRGDSLPEQPILREQRLLGITLETKGSGAGRIDILTGGDLDGNNTHVIAHPTAVKVQTRTPDGFVDTLLIESPAGEPTTVIRFLSAT